MNLFEAVKDAVPTRTAAEHYGIEVKRNGMACCPFHDDRTPSMKVDKRFHCFGCQEDGDVIDFVGKLFDLSPKRAAEKLAEDFGVRYEGLQTWQPQRRPSVISKLAAAQEYRKKENRCYRVLCEYLHLLSFWKKRRNRRLWRSSTRRNSGQISTDDLGGAGLQGCRPAPSFSFSRKHRGGRFRLHAGRKPRLSLQSRDNSVREPNAQPAPATGLFTGFGVRPQRAKMDFQRSRWKSILSICGNKCTARQVAQLLILKRYC